MSPAVRTWRKALLGAIAMLTLSSSVGAQDQSGGYFPSAQNVGVSGRARPDYDAIGIPLGTFLLYPKLDLVTTYDDNIYVTQSNPTSDLIFQVEPQLDLQSQWENDHLNLFGHADINKYADHSGEDTNDYGAGVNGSADILTSTQLGAGFQYDHDTMPRETEIAQQFTRNPLQYDYSLANIEGTEYLDRLQIEVNLERTRYAFDNAMTEQNQFLSEQYLDYVNWSETLRLAYAVSPDTSIFVSGIRNNDIYDLVPPAVSLNRNSDGYNVTGGVHLELTNLISGEIGGGYFEENYPHVTGQNAGGFLVRAAFDWYPTQLTTVNIQTDRTVEESAVVTSVGYVSSMGRIEVDHELRRNVIVSLIGKYAVNDYQGYDRHDRDWSLGLNGTYLVNRIVALTLGYGHDHQTSGGLDHGIDFDLNKVSLTLVLHR
jgi:hypothetical protein